MPIKYFFLRPVASKFLRGVLRAREGADGVGVGGFTSPTGSSAFCGLLRRFRIDFGGRCPSVVAKSLRLVPFALHVLSVHDRQVSDI